jgi:acetylglutamate kinase
MKTTRLILLLTFVIGHIAASSRAETIYLINGDQIQAKVVSLDSQSLSLHSDILGTLSIPRSKIARIDFVQLQKTAANRITLKGVKPLQQGKQHNLPCHRRSLES